MKKMLLLLSILFLPFLLWSQKIHFTDNTNGWRVLHTNNGPPTVYDVEFNSFSAVDTVLDSIAYKVLSGSLIREDTLLKKVFILINDTEQVLMDYNLNVGDSLMHKDYDGNIFLNVVTNIDSVMINSLEYKIWNFSTFYLGGISTLATTGYSVVEGIGCLNGPLFINSPFLGLDEVGLTCFYNNGSTPSLSQPLYTGSHFYFDNQNSCTLATDNITLPKITLFPNPATSELTITYTDKITRLFISNLIGQTVFMHDYNSDKVFVDISHLPTGVYFTKINGQEIRKFIKE